MHQVRNLDGSLARKRGTFVSSVSDFGFVSSFGFRISDFRAAGRRPRGVVLLEVLLAMTLFLLSAIVVGAAMSGSIAATTDMRQEDKAVNMAKTVLAQIASGVSSPVTTAATEFDPVKPGWTYEIQADDLADAHALKRVTVIIRSTQAVPPVVYRVTQWMLDPTAALSPASPDAAGSGMEGG